jgi:ABC-type transporter Mla subunit MlaD
MEVEDTMSTQIAQARDKLEQAKKQQASLAALSGANAAVAAAVEAQKEIVKKLGGELEGLVQARRSENPDQWVRSLGHKIRDQEKARDKHKKNLEKHKQTIAELETQLEKARKDATAADEAMQTAECKLEDMREQQAAAAAKAAPVAKAAVSEEKGDEETLEGLRAKAKAGTLRVGGGKLPTEFVDKLQALLVSVVLPGETPAAQERPAEGDAEAAKGKDGADERGRSRTRSPRGRD